MIPLRLNIKNFMCYRDNVPPLDLEGVHVACLCGDNGHGKTAILDAITWALWGQARTRTQEELIHQGQLDMAVELEFRARDQRYRVSRRHSRSARSRQGTSILELQVASDNGFRPITDSTLRDTEARVRDILHMDYDTFVNTAFLRQGDADRFTTSRPAERKATLAEVLDLSYYERLEGLAKEKSRAGMEEVRKAESAIAVRQQEIDRKPEHELALASAREELARTAPRVEGERTRVAELRDAVASLQGEHREMEELTRRLAGDERDVAQLLAQGQSHAAKVAEYESAMEREGEIGERFADLQQRRADLEDLNRALGLRSDLDGEKARVVKEIAVQHERLSAQAAQVRSRVADDLEPKVRRLPEIEEALAEAGRERTALAEADDLVRQRRLQGEEIAARVRDLKTANQRLRGEMDETRKKFDMLERGNTVCPLCKQPLGSEGQAHLRREYEAHGLRSRDAYQRDETEQKELKGTLGALTAKLSHQEGEVSRARSQIDNKTAVLERDRDESQTARAQLQQEAAELQRLDSLLHSQGFALEERHLLAELDTRLGALGYSAESHAQVREEVTALSGFDELHRKLQEAAERLPSERDALTRTQQMLDRRRQEEDRLRSRIDELERGLKDMPAKESALKDAESLLQELDGQRQRLLVQTGVLENSLERCVALEKELKGHEDDRRRWLEEKSVYDELAVAFGRNGIQALIIETAIPQLEADANELLGRLTDNRMFLRLQLQEGRRDGRTGIRSEELDIKIADEVGTRSYETFSGGEAFRINFALRIALSRLLARRSGAPLPILFIDEGFGSQDTAGQERLTEAIQSIQDDFQKIIVITHIEQIKEAFSTRIEVTKTGDGSTFRMT